MTEKVRDHGSRVSDYDALHEKPSEGSDCDWDMIGEERRDVASLSWLVTV